MWERFSVAISNDAAAENRFRTIPLMTTYIWFIPNKKLLSKYPTPEKMQ